MQILNEFITKRYLQIAQKYRMLETEECEKITYVLKSILGEIEKTFMLLILFSFIGEFSFWFIGSICIVSIRIFLGGTHKKTYWGCFAFSCFFFQSAYVLSQKISFHEYFILFLWIMYVFFILLFAPLLSDKKPKFKTTTRKKLKLISFVVVSAWVIFCLNCSNDLGNYIVWLLLLQMLEIVRVKGGKRLCDYISKNVSMV